MLAYHPPRLLGSDWLEPLRPRARGSAKTSTSSEPVAGTRYAVGAPPSPRTPAALAALGCDVSRGCSGSRPWVRAARRTLRDEGSTPSTSTMGGSSRGWGMARRCLTCGVLTTATRCPTCSKAKDRARNARRSHYGGSYQARRAALLEQARATNAPCSLCGEAIAYHLAWPHPLSFTADHVRAGDPDSPLAPTHAHCNASRGAKPRRTP